MERPNWVRVCKRADGCEIWVGDDGTIHFVGREEGKLVGELVYPPADAPLDHPMREIARRLWAFCSTGLLVERVR